MGILHLSLRNCYLTIRMAAIFTMMRLAVGYPRYQAGLVAAAAPAGLIATQVAIKQHVLAGV